MRKFFLLLTILSIFSCGKTTKQKSSMVVQDVSAIYRANLLKVHVFYETGAEPYTDGALPGVQIWNLLERNLEALFQGRSKPPLISVPKTLAEMTLLSSAPRTKWSVENVLSLSKSLSVAAPSGTKAFKILFLNGRAAEGAGVIGFHIDGTTVMAIFKDVIKENGNAFVRRFVEQATLIHEMAHALGLVNNGVPMRSEHQDKAHGAHCKNQDCVMYWSNEGASDLQSFYQKILLSGGDPESLVMFDAQCLEDTRRY
jgi:hypothetical protein